MVPSRIVFVCAIVLVCVASGCGSTPGMTSPAPSAATPTGPFADMSGMWTGTLESANFSPRTITLTVAQTSNCVDGAWISATGDWRGAISGFATADAFDGFITFQRSADGGGECTATSTLSGPASQGAILMTAGSLKALGACVGVLPTGIVLTLHR